MRLLKGRCAAWHAAQPLHSRGALVLELRGGASPRRPTPISNPRIIYDGNESINNSRNHKNTPRRRGAAPHGRSPKKRGWRRNAPVRQYSRIDFL